jgi:hypothetical protein
MSTPEWKRKRRAKQALLKALRRATGLGINVQETLYEEACRLNGLRENRKNSEKRASYLLPLIGLNAGGNIREEA